VKGYGQMRKIVKRLEEKGCPNCRNELNKIFKEELESMKKES